MTHEQGTFGASPEYVTVTITHLRRCYDDFAVDAKMPSMFWFLFRHILFYILFKM